MFLKSKCKDRLFLKEHRRRFAKIFTYFIIGNVLIFVFFSYLHKWMQWQEQRLSGSFLELLAVLWLGLSNFLSASVTFQHLVISEKSEQLSSILPALALPCWYRRILFYSAVFSSVVQFGEEFSIWSTISPVCFVL